MKFRFKGLLQNDGWIQNALVIVDSEGIVTSIEPDAEDQECDEVVNGFALPGFQNAHSHSFQYAMAGLAENHSNTQDNFWSWRDAMYKLALSVNPDQLEAIATMLYAEMLRHGYTNVAEFHYLHHDTSGKPYINVAEMGLRLVSAAKVVGINIALIPIFYQKGGFGSPPEERQRRFISPDVESYSNLFEASARACDEYKGANIGIGAHSMRGVEPLLIKEVAEGFPDDIPFHIHISEQLREVEDCISYLGKRPVQWMIENTSLSERFHFIHATHVNEDEIYGLANMNVNVVLCPTTEANLGDGIFPLREFQECGGRWSIGTDSHVSLNPFEELRLLDYGQRLKTQKRNTFVRDISGNSGLYAINQATVSGRKAMNNFEVEYFKVGQPLNACVISAAHPLIQTTSRENLLNTIIYSSDESMQIGTLVNGQWKSKDGSHCRQDEIVRNFIRALKELNIR